MQSFSGSSCLPAGANSTPSSEEALTALHLTGIDASEEPLLGKQAALLESLGASPISAGNRATLLVDGANTLKAMYAAIRGARDHVNLETYIMRDDEIGRSFADLLSRKRAEGVVVNVMYDSFGCRTTPARFFRRLAEKGVNVVEFNSLSPFRLNNNGRWFHHRNHRKVLIVDGTVAFTGGVNIGTTYCRNTPGRLGKDGAPEFWRDTHVKIEGPAVREFQKVFLKTWESQKGAASPTAHYFPPQVDLGSDLVGIVCSSPGAMNRLTYVMYVSALAYARKRIYLTQSYFVPTREIVDALIQAANRGVDVRIMLPAHSDHTTTLYAGRSYYEDLLGAGVKLYERCSSILHAKTAVIDGVWSTIGSSNMEPWSFTTNDEINAVIMGKDFGKKMELMFHEDTVKSRQIYIAEWQQRTLDARLKEIGARLVSYWL